MYFKFTNKSLFSRVKRVAKARGDQAVMRTAQTLLHERLLDIEENGDPAALHPVPEPQTTPDAAGPARRREAG